MVPNGLKPSNFKEWLWSAKVLTTIVWILFPSGYIIFINIPTLWEPATGEFISNANKRTYAFNKFLEGPYDVIPIPDTPILERLTYIPPLPYMVVLFLFSVYPAIYHTEKFFKKRGSENAVIEYRYIRKILIAFLIALIIIITSYYLTQIHHSCGSGSCLIEVGIFGASNPVEFIVFIYRLNVIFYVTIFVLPTVPIFILLKLLLEHARKQFRFYYAKACFKIMNEKKNETDKNEYLLLGLDWYNKFVKRVTKSSIDIQTIYSKIISLSQLSNNILLDTIRDSFHNGDEFNPMRHMLALLACWKEGATLVKESLRTKIRESSDLLIPIVTVIITIITTFFLRPPTSPGT